MGLHNGGDPSSSSSSSSHLLSSPIRFVAPAPTLCLPKRLLLIRHGESVANVERSTYATTPDWKIELTERGKQQAADCGRRLQRLVRNDKLFIYYSPYKRTTQTLAQIRPFLNSQQILGEREDERLREQEMGNFQPCVEDGGMDEQWEERNVYGRSYYRFPSGESGLDVFDRVGSFFDALLKEGMNHRTSRLPSPPPTTTTQAAATEEREKLLPTARQLQTASSSAFFGLPVITQRTTSGTTPTPHHPYAVHCSLDPILQHPLHIATTAAAANLDSKSVVTKTVRTTTVPLSAAEKKSVSSSSVQDEATVTTATTFSITGTPKYAVTAHLENNNSSRSSSSIPRSSTPTSIRASSHAEPFSVPPHGRFLTSADIAIAADPLHGQRPRGGGVVLEAPPNDDDDDFSVVIVAHGLLIRLFIGRWFGIPTEELEMLTNPPNCSITVLQRDASRTKLTLTPVSKKLFGATFATKW